MNKITAAVAATLLALSGSAFAAEHGDAGMKMESSEASAFIQADTNGDGAVDQAEAEAAGLSDKFASADTNQDGKLDQSEFSALEVQPQGQPQE